MSVKKRIIYALSAWFSDPMFLVMFMASAFILAFFAMLVMW